MTMEDQGIMALPQGMAMQGPTAQPAAQAIDPAAMAAFEQARMEADPKEFGDALLNEASNADPVTVQEFVSMLQRTNLPPEIIDALGQIVDMILAEPDKYDEIRKGLIAEGVPEDILPPEFDAAYFGALNMALDQMNANLMAPTQGFAMGGEAKMTPIASGLAGMGRNGDTRLAHINMSEARMLRRRGGSGTINPVTGLPEFFIKNVFKAVGSAFKSVGKAVTGAVKGIAKGIKSFASSTIGRIVTTVALGFFLGPAAASLLGVGATTAAGMAISGFVGGFGSTLLAGGKLKDALKVGALSGITAGALSGLGGAPLIGEATMTPGQALSQQFSKFTSGIQSLGTSAVPDGIPVESSKLSTTPIEGTTAPRPISPTTAEQLGASVDSFDAAQGAPFARPGGLGPVSPTTVDQLGASVDSFDAAQGTPFNRPYQQTPAEFMRSVEPRQLGPAPQPSASALGDIAPQAETSGFIDKAKGFYNEYLSPSRGMPTSQDIIDRANIIKSQFPGMTADAAYAAAEKQLAKEAPSFLYRYGPMAAATTGIAALSGAFTPKQPGPPGIVSRETGQDLLRKSPEIYGVTPGGGYITYGLPSFVFPPKFADGGIASLPSYAKGGTSEYPRRTGPINGPGTGTSDSIPAMLSDGEFVFTAKAVRAAGGGSRRAGAKRMYAMMKALERKANG